MAQKRWQWPDSLATDSGLADRRDGAVLMPSAVGVHHRGGPGRRRPHGHQRTRRRRRPARRAASCGPPPGAIPRASSQATDAASRSVEAGRRLKIQWPNLLPGIRTLALLTRSRGAKRGANDHRHRAAPGHLQPFPLRSNGTSGHTQHRPGILRKCLLSSRSRVRVAVGAQVRGLGLLPTEWLGAKLGAKVLGPVDSVAWLGEARRVWMWRLT